MDTPPTPLASLKEAVKRIGSQSAMARLLGVTQAAVWGWLNRGTALPAEHVLAVEAATGIAKEKLRPDLYRLEAALLPTIAEPAK